MQHSFCISLKNRGKDHFPVTKKPQTFLTICLHHAHPPFSSPSLFPIILPLFPPSLSFLFFSCLFFFGSRIGVAQWPDPWRENSWKDAMSASPLLSSLPPLPLPSSSPPPPPFFLSFHQSVVSVVTFIWKLPACRQQQEKVKNGKKKKAKEKTKTIRARGLRAQFTRCF